MWAYSSKTTSPYASVLLLLVVLSVLTIYVRAFCMCLQRDKDIIFFCTKLNFLTAGKVVFSYIKNGGSAGIFMSTSISHRWNEHTNPTSTRSAFLIYNMARIVSLKAPNCSIRRLRTENFSFRSKSIQFWLDHMYGIKCT